MEPKIKAKIEENLPKLINFTVCSAEFLAIFRSKSIFSKSDVITITSEETNNGQLAASSKFYDMLTSRSGSYDVLLEALKETNQSGAIAILNLSKSPVNPSTKTSPLKFNPKSPKYITDYVSQSDGCYLLVSSHDCKLTCDWILESTENCKLYNIADLLDTLSESQEPVDEQTILLANLEDNLDPIYTIRQNTQIKVVLVTRFDEAEKLQQKLPHPQSAWKIAGDNIQWKDLNSKTQLKITTGLKQSLALDSQELTTALSNIDTKNLVDLLNEKYPKPEDLFCDKISTPISFYVNRTLQTRFIITKEILNHVFYEEFVLFSGIERHVLSNMSDKILVESSSNLLRKKKKTSAFVFLENEMDFDSISAIFPDHSIHFLEYECNEFIWRKSRGRLSNLQKFVASKQRTLLESKFVSEILGQKNSNPICISDTPGKGKSVLLANLANEVRKQRKTGIVAFIEIKQLFQNLKAEKPIFPHQISLNLSQFLSKSTLGHAYLSVNKHYLHELMLDGFDEIDADDTEFAFESLTQIRSLFCDTRIWITSRPHMLPELESHLETLGYNITPFTKDDQIHFLSSFWSNRLENCDKQSLSTFAVECLNTLKDSLGPTSEDIAGIPLQCLLIGEAYENDAERFVKSSSSKTPTFSQQITSIEELYRRLIEKKLENFQSKYNTNKLSKSEIFKAHFQLSLKTLYPSHATKFSDKLGHSMSMQDIFDFGLIEAKSVLSAPQFLHQTFAEYFVALFASGLIGEVSSDEFLDFLFTYIMVTDETEISIHPISFTSKFRSNVTCYFLNAFVEKELILRDNAYFIDFERMCSISEACIFQNLENLFLKLVFVNKSKWNVINEDLIVKTVFWTDVHFLNVIFKEYLSLSGITPIVVINCMKPNQESFYREHISDSRSLLSWDSGDLIDEGVTYTLLHLAMRKSDNGTVNYLVTNHFRESLKINSKCMYNNLISYLLRDSASDNKWIIVEKINILNYLATINKYLLILSDERPNTFFESENYHPELALEVWKLCKECCNKTNVAIHVFQKLSTQMSYENFYTFIKAVFSTLDNITIENQIRKTKLLQNICKMKHLSTELLNFLKDQCSSFCDVSSEDKVSIFAIATLYQEENILEWLLNNLAYTSQNIKVLFTKCLDIYDYNRAVNVLYSHNKWHKDLKGIPDFYEMFEFLFVNKHLETFEQSFTIIHLVSFFIWKTQLKCFKKMNTESTLTHLIETGFSYFEQLALTSMISKSYGCVLKFVWTTYVCSNLKRDLFASRLKLYTKDIEIHASDTCGNTLLHIFARHFTSDRLTSKFDWFFKEILSLKRIEGKGYNSGHHKDIWKFLMEANLSILQFNNNQQSPLCLLQPNGYSSLFSETILPAVEQMINRKVWDISNIHQMFYLILKSHNINLVHEVYGWYSNFCKSEQITVASVKVVFGGEQSNFLDAAVKSGNGYVLKFVIDVLKIKIPTLPPSLTCIHHSIESGFLFFKDSTMYISRMAEIFPNEIRQLVNHFNDKRLVPLSLLHVDSNVIKHLHNFGANVNAADANGNTPLHFVFIHEYFGLATVKQLIQCGSNVNAKNLKMESPLMILIRNIKTELISDFDYMSVGIECFELLIRNNADPCIQDDDGNTVIHSLVKKIVSGNIFHSIIKSLILNKVGNVLSIKNHEGLTPLQLADKYFHIVEETQQLLKKHDIFYSEL